MKWLRKTLIRKTFLDKISSSCLVSSLLLTSNLLKSLFYANSLRIHREPLPLSFSLHLVRNVGHCHVMIGQLFLIHKRLPPRVLHHTGFLTLFLYVMFLCFMSSCVSSLSSLQFRLTFYIIYPWVIWCPFYNKALEKNFLSYYEETGIHERDRDDHNH